MVYLCLILVKFFAQSQRLQDENVGTVATVLGVVSCDDFSSGVKEI